METLWFCLLVFMLATYVVLDGFDFGVGILHLLVAKNEPERQQVHQTIGPVWDGNEVWLIALGGCLFMAFPKFFAVAFAGFYLPLTIVLWLLMFRALGIELRHQIRDSLWTQFWDVAFSLSSLLLAFVIGTALGNVVRGVSFGEDGTFFAPLWTDWRVSGETGVFDWFTVLYGVTTTVSLAHHGALWLSARTTGQVQQRARRFAMLLWPAVAVLAVAVVVTTFSVQTNMAGNLKNHPWIFVWIVLAISGLSGSFFWRLRYSYNKAFLGSCLYLYAMVAAGASWSFPYILPGRAEDTGLTVYAAASSEYGMRVALYWWTPGVLLVFCYMVFVFRTLPKPSESTIEH